MADNRPIGLFDSGVGGLSVLIEIKKILPKESFVFFADQNHNPYGAKTPKELKTLSEKITKFLLRKDIKLLIVACNTASCYAIGHLRSKFTIPIIGVVPAVKPAMKLTKNKKICIMSTPATSKSSYLSSLISKYATKANVLKLGCDGLEESIEYLKLKTVSKLLDKYIRQATEFGADVIILGCTHFPFLKGDIIKTVGKKVTVIDSGEAIAKRVGEILSISQSLAESRSCDYHFTTGDPRKFSQVATKLLKYKVNAKVAKI